MVACQNERSQLRNRDTAMRILKARLFEIAEKKQREELAELTGPEEGDRLRQPDPLLHVPPRISWIKDHRTGHEIGNVEAVMDGDLDELIKAYLLWARGRRREPRPESNELVRQRHDKLEALRPRGIDPFGGRYPGDALGRAGSHARLGPGAARTS